MGHNFASRYWHVFVIPPILWARILILSWFEPVGGVRVEAA